MRITRVAAGVVVIAVLAAGCGASGSQSTGAATRVAAASADSAGRPPSISAQGVGRATGIPDVLTVAFGVHTEGASAQQTLNDNSARTKSVLDALKSQGVADKDVQTTYITVGPRYDPMAPPRIVGFSADNSFTVRLRDLAKAGAEIDTLVGVGGDALQIRGIGYSMNDSTALLAEARADAVKRATEQAQQMAGAAGVKLGRVRSVSEVAQPFGYPMDRAQALVGAASSSPASVPLAPGSQDLTLTVTMVFDIA